MITLEKDGKKMTVSSELQASVFIRNGYSEVKPVAKPVEEDVKVAKPKRRRKAE